MNLVNILLILLILGAGIFFYYFGKDYREKSLENKIEEEGSLVSISIIGFFVCFFDTLGIGGFAPLTACFKNFKLVNDRIIPGTLNTAMCIPIIFEALIFIKDVKVESITLVSMLISSVLGAILGAGIVAKMDEKKIQLGMSLALGAVFLIMFAGKLNIMPVGGNAIGLTGVKLFIAVLGNFILGILMTLGIGLYAPCMALVYTLGMSPLVAFPVMMASCALLMPPACVKFIKEDAYNKRCTLIITIFGSIGVIIAAYLVKSLPLSILTWVVMAAIAYTSIKIFIDYKLSPIKK